MDSGIWDGREGEIGCVYVENSLQNVPSTDLMDRYHIIRSLLLLLLFFLLLFLFASSGEEEEEEKRIIETVKGVPIHTS